MNTQEIQDLMHWSYAYGKPGNSARIRVSPEDFQVDEILGFEPSGEGQHRMLLVRKRNTNTEWLAKQLARHANVPPRNVGYAGLKDRHAVTTQWYSLDLAGKTEPNWQSFATEDYEVLQSTPHNKKIRKGILKANRFRLILRDYDGDAKELEQRLTDIAEHGVPNYFGEQRFGNVGGNLVQAWKMLHGEIKIKDRHRKGLYLSAARSLLFNQVLSERIEQQCWNTFLPGEPAMLNGTQSFFVVDQIDNKIQQRLQEWDIHPSGPLWGRGDSLSTGEVKALEDTVISRYHIWSEGLEKSGLQQDRRPLRLRVEELRWQWLDKQVFSIEFQLVAGSYATSVLRELITIT
jgi:tRNA pseudouridine13 synthase